MEATAKRCTRFFDYCIFNTETIPGGITMVIGCMAMFALLFLPTILAIFVNTVFLEPNLLPAFFTIIGMTAIAWIIGSIASRSAFFKKDNNQLFVNIFVGLNSGALVFYLGLAVGILPGYLLYEIAVFFNLTLQNNENLLMLFGTVGILGSLTAFWFGIMFFAGMGVELWNYLSRKLCVSN